MPDEQQFAATNVESSGGTFNEGDGSVAAKRSEGRQAGVTPGQGPSLGSPSGTAAWRQR